MFSKEKANEKEEKAARDYFWEMKSRTGGEWSGEDRMETESGEGMSEWRRRVEWGEVDGEGECEVGRSR